LQMDYSLLIIICHSAIATVSFSINFLLLFSMLFFTPRSSRPFTILMIFHTVMEILNTLSSFSSMSRILLIDWHLVFISYGPC
ncbi:hypothetical protein PMAYCL1PPCAC_30252, partial [Pristionchus mayeri]